MSKKNQIQINDFNLFADMIKSALKIVESARISISSNGVAIYGCRGTYTRCELVSNSIQSNEDIDINIEKLSIFYKILSTIQDIHKDDYSDFKFFIEMPKIIFESKKFKTKFQTQNDADIISKWISKKVEVALKPEFEFTTTSDYIKRINSHSYIFENQTNLRVYLETKVEMENNALFATLGNKENDLNNEMILKFGIVTSGKLTDDRKLILDLEHLNLFNAIQSNDIKIFLPEKYNMLVSKTKVDGKNGTYLNINIYNALFKN